MLLLCHINSSLCLFSGEWEISAFDGSLKSRGMSIHYTVRPCDNGDLPLVDRDEDDISDYIDQLDLRPRGTRPQNRTMLVRVCKKLLTNNNTQSVNIFGQNVTDDKTEGTGAERQSGCQLKIVTLTSQEGEEPTMMSEGTIPPDILEEIEMGEERTVSHNGTEDGGERGVRQRREAEVNWTDVDISSGASEDGGAGIEIQEQAVENMTDTGAEIKAEERNEMSSVNNGTKEDLEESNEILLNSNPLLNKKTSTVEPTNSEDQNYIQSEPEKLKADLLDLKYNYTADSNNTTGIGLSVEYDDYNQEVLFSVCVCLLYIY